MISWRGSPVVEKNGGGRNFARRRTAKKAGSGSTWAPPEVKRQRREERKGGVRGGGEVAAGGKGGRRRWLDARQGREGGGRCSSGREAGDLPLPVGWRCWRRLFFGCVTQSTEWVSDLGFNCWSQSY
jgi:hypothetical protein